MNNDIKTNKSLGFNAETPHPNVLLVEDDLSARWLMRNALKGKCTLHSATSGEEALEIYQRHRPEIVVLDYCLPQQKGDAVLHLLLQEDPDAHIIVMSSSENLSALNDMHASGAKGMLIKPFTKEEFLGCVFNTPQSDTFFYKGR